MAGLQGTLTQSRRGCVVEGTLATSPQSPGSGKTALIVVAAAGGILLLVLLVCGGGAYLLMMMTVRRVEQRAEQAAQKAADLAAKAARKVRQAKEHLRGSERVAQRFLSRLQRGRFDEAYDSMDEAYRRRTPRRVFNRMLGAREGRARHRWDFQHTDMEAVDDRTHVFRIHTADGTAGPTLILTVARRDDQWVITDIQLKPAAGRRKRRLVP